MRLASSGSNHAALISLVLAGGTLVACAKTSASPDGALLPPIAVPVTSVSAPTSATSAAPPPVEQGVVVDLLDDGKVTIDGVEVAIDAVKDTFAKKPREELAVFRSGASTHWGRVVHLLDLMKQAGNRDFVLAIRNDPARRTKRIGFPKASEVGPPPVAPGPGGPAPDFDMHRLVSVMILQDGKMMVDGTDLSGPLRDRLHTALGGNDESKPRVIVHGDRQAPYSTIIDAAMAAQAENALVAFAVSPAGTSLGPAPPPADSSRPRPKPKR